MFESNGSLLIGAVPRPTTGVQFHDLEVNYSDGSHPLRIRVHPEARNVPITVGLERPRSCADVFLKRFEKHTPTQIAALRAAFTLNHLIARSGENSCDRWPLRAEKARYDRYYNAMERSDFLVIPDAVKSAYRAAAANTGDRQAVERIIASGDEAERRRFAVSLQRTVLAAFRDQNFTAAFEASSALLEASRTPEFSSAIAKEITLEALEKQTSDLAIQAGQEPPPAPAHDDGDPD